MNIFLDAETIPTQQPDDIAALQADLKAELDDALDALRAPSNYKDEAKIAAYIDEKRNALIDEHGAKFDTAWRNTSFDGGLCHVVCVSIAIDHHEPIALVTNDWRSLDAERELLHRVNDSLKRVCGHHMGQRLIGHNISFDRRVLRQRGIIHRTLMHRLLTREVKPWENDLVFDTMTAWTGDMRDKISMDKLCRYLGLPGKGGIDGSKVWDHVRDGKLALVAEYCKDDVRRTRAMFNRLTFAEPVQQPEFDDVPA